MFAWSPYLPERRLAGNMILMLTTRFASGYIVAMLTTDIPPPPKRNKTRRLTESMKAMQPGQSAAYAPEVARCLQAYGLHVGWDVRTKKQPDGLVRVWRVS